MSWKLFFDTSYLFTRIMDTLYDNGILYKLKQGVIKNFNNSTTYFSWNYIFYSMRFINFHSHYNTMHLMLGRWLFALVRNTLLWSDSLLTEHRVKHQNLSQHSALHGNVTINTLFWFIPRHPRQNICMRMMSIAAHFDMPKHVLKM